jgi:hypothetical protein
MRGGGPPARAPEPGTARSCGTGRRGLRPGLIHGWAGAWPGGSRKRAAGLDDESIESLLRVALRAETEEGIA